MTESERMPGEMTPEHKKWQDRYSIASHYAFEVSLKRAEEKVSPDMAKGWSAYYKELADARNLAYNEAYTEKMEELEEADSN